MANQSVKMNQLTKKLLHLREKKAHYNRKIREIEDEYANIEQQLFEVFDAQGIQKIGTNAGTLFIKESVVPHVNDWDALYKYIHRHRFYHLLQRRPSVTGFRELFDQGKEVPGVEQFKKRSMNLRERD